MSKLKVVIEIPKGDNRRRHLAYDKSGIIDLGPLIEAIPLNNGLMPVHYCYVPNTKSAEGDELDLLLIDYVERQVGDEVEVRVIALIEREDQDHKIVAVLPDSFIEKWEDVEISLRTLLLEYFGHKHKIISVGSKSDAENLINQGTI